MTITATELKNNLGKYLILAATEDIFITKNGKTIAKLTSPYQNKLDTVDALFGSIPDTITFVFRKSAIIVALKQLKFGKY